MEIVYFLLAILVAFVAVLMVRRIYDVRHNIPLYPQMRQWTKTKKGQPPPPPATRLFMAVRRGQASQTSLLQMANQEYQAWLLRISTELDNLIKEWSHLASFEWGFRGSDYGLPSNNENNWMLFATFIVADHPSYRQCMAILESDAYLFLRNNCDIHLLYGEQMGQLHSHVHELF
ncbi:MAG: hypothetical protein EHM72_01375 [Calditrichaeota bacterium]|nr:MAG: hypothetical protein EHM72_01375 [Calditrichota bacterium]